MISTADKYQFVKVDDFFDDYKSWHAIKSAALESVNTDTKDVALTLTSDIGTHALVLQFASEDTFRLRFDPGAAKSSDYDKGNTRAIVQNDFDTLRGLISDFTLVADQRKSSVALTTRSSKSAEVMQVVINYSPFAIDVYGFDSTGAFSVYSTSNPAFYFKENGFDAEYSIIQSIDKRPTAKYVGFGEQGGKDLVKNTAQLTFFNFDNMKYMQVYGNGPLESREPLYHSDPFFLEFYGVPGRKSVYGIFIDNPSEVCMDIGYLNASRYLFGTRFGSMDYYFMLGKCAVDIVDAFTSLVGKSRLKPRYALGYHQGCYGYDTREKVINCANSYRAPDVDIPLDGIHIDVDIQHNHKTFTIDVTGNFPNPRDMFSYLRSLGVKCSTNITPIISRENPDDAGDPENNPVYNTYYSGLQNNYFLNDVRSDAQDWDARTYHYYEGSGNRETVADNNFNSGKTYVGGINYGYSPLFYGYYPDFGRKEVRVWWGKQYQYLFDMGLEMVWQDMTTPAIAATQYWDSWQQKNVGFGDMKSFPARLQITNDFYKAFEPDTNAPTTYPQTPFIKVWNLYAYNLHKATYHGLNYLPGRENKRNFIIGRGSFAGAQRFAALWTGDNASSWDFLKINISQCLALGLTGQAIAGQDIGGFEKGDDNGQWADPELLIRWTVAGAFLPWFRNHYTAKPGAKLFQEPYNYRYHRDCAPENYKYMYDAVLPVCKYYIELRYRLMQLFYDCMFESTLDGMPISRALFLANDDEALFNDKVDFLSDEFMVGNDLLVAPILDKGHTNRDVYLPAGGNWYCYMDNRQPLSAALEGGTTLNYHANIDAYNPNHIPFTVPLYVRAGAIIPAIDRERYVGELNGKGLPRPITLNVYPCAQDVSGTYTMYLDDGVSRSSASKDTYDDDAKDEYRQTEITHKYAGPTTRQIRINRVHDGYTPKLETFFYLAILHDNAQTLKQVTINGAGLPQITDGSAEDRANALNASGVNAWYYNENIRISFVKVFDNNSVIEVVAAYNA